MAVIDKYLKPLNRFLYHENAGGLVLFSSVVIAIILANSPFSEAYAQVWETRISIGVGEHSLSHSLHRWVNDGFMAIFFFVVGLELKREFIAGELSSFRKAVLPMAAALGGMIAPAVIYMIFNRGFGIRSRVGYAHGNRHCLRYGSATTCREEGAVICKSVSHYTCNSG